MTIKGRQKYKCRDCGKIRFPSTREINRRNGLVCFECGGIIDPFTQKAIERREIGRRRRENHDINRGDIVKSY